MGVKSLVCAAAFMLAGLNSFAISSDSLLVKNKAERVKIGPSNFDATPVDSALLRKLLVKERLQKKDKETQELIKYQNTLLLRNLLNETETSEVPNERILSTLDLVLEEYRRTGDIKSESLILNTLAVYYGKKGESDKAIQYFKEALILKERLNDKPGMIKIAENMAAIYQIAGKYDKAAIQNEYYIQLSLAQKKTAQAAEGYLSLAENKLLQNKYTESEYCILKKALPMFTRTGNKAGRLKSFESLARIYYTQNRLSEAKWFYIQAQTLATKLNNKEAMLSSLIHLAQIKSALGEHEMALNDYREAELLALRNNFPVKLVQIKAEIGEVYSQMGNYLAAGSALDEYSKLREDLLKSVTL
ncbi:tetratricopeptide repeat protein [Arcticibacter tournemirensis]|uniref:Tetratricopeptide repeat protein n=1 Tax=Arcticibacter tournemirensis TaxID=699437 RepID=A0A4Q0MEI9_9SPHI|nr:tetratricopeptide repeat protein [Arcticibacter tournemirensis]RXF71847.1 tetratricopeptide repeat protein [Arcticibacter tournemirensis]